MRRLGVLWELARIAQLELGEDVEHRSAAPGDQQLRDDAAEECALGFGHPLCASNGGLAGPYYASPAMGGFEAMVTCAANANANQALSLKDAVQNNDRVSEDLINAAASWSSSMGGMGISLGAELNN